MPYGRRVDPPSAPPRPTVPTTPIPPSVPGDTVPQPPVEPQSISEKAKMEETVSLGEDATGRLLNLRKEIL